MQIFAVSEVSGGPYCNCNLNSRTETNVADLIFMCQLVTTSNSQEIGVLFICCKVYLLQMINSGGLHAVKW